MKVCFLYFSGSDTNFTLFLEKITYGVSVTMENTEYQTTLALRENITFDEKVEIEDLVLSSEQTGTSNMKNRDIKEEPMDPQFSSAHERRKLSGFSTFNDEMEIDISKLFEEFDMMSLHDYDKMRVKKVRQLVEKYQRIEQKEQLNTVEMLQKNVKAKTSELTKLEKEYQSTKHDFDLKINLMSSENNFIKETVGKITKEYNAAMSLNSKTMSSIVKMHEKALDDKNNELNDVKLDLQIAKSTNLALSNRVQKLESSSNNQVILDKKEKFKPNLKTFDNEEPLANCYVNFKKIADKEFKTARPFAYKIHSKSIKACENVFTCETCPKIFKTKKGLSQHHQTHDKNSRKLCCPQEECGMKFYNKTSFDNHMNVHFGIKPHKCRDCGKAYADSGARNKHFRRCHQ